MRINRLIEGNNVWNQNRKKRGFSLVEVLSVITIMAILAVISVPSFRGWLDKETYNRQVVVLFDSLNEARAGMLSEKNCPSGNPAESWGVRLTMNDFGVWCVSVGGVSERVTFNDIDVNDYTFDNRIIMTNYTIGNESNFDNLQPFTAVWIEFLVATKQVRINDDFSNKSIQIQMDYLFTDGIENTICLDRYSQFSFFSAAGNCSEL